MDSQHSGDVFSYPHHIRRARGSVPTELCGGMYKNGNIHPVLLLSTVHAWNTYEHESLDTNIFNKFGVGKRYMWVPVQWVENLGLRSSLKVLYYFLNTFVPSLVCYLVSSIP